MVSQCIWTLSCLFVVVVWFDACVAQAPGLVPGEFRNVDSTWGQFCHLLHRRPIYPCTFFERLVEYLDRTDLGTVTTNGREVPMFLAVPKCATRHTTDILREEYGPRWPEIEFPPLSLRRGAATGDRWHAYVHLRSGRAPLDGSLDPPRGFQGGPGRAPARDAPECASAAADVARRGAWARLLAPPRVAFSLVRDPVERLLSAYSFGEARAILAGGGVDSKSTSNRTALLVAAATRYASHPEYANWQVAFLVGLRTPYAAAAGRGGPDRAPSVACAAALEASRAGSTNQGWGLHQNGVTSTGESRDHICQRTCGPALRDFDETRSPL